MKGFGIYVKNDLLDPKHVITMGATVWLYLWLLDKMTSISESGKGKVLGGKPIKFEDDIEPDLGIDRRTYLRYVKTLREAGYVETKRTPYGMIFTVNKATKIFTKRSDKNVTSEKKRSDKKCMLDATEMSHQCDKFVTSNKDNTVDNTNNKTNLGAEAPKKENGLITISENPEPVVKKTRNPDVEAIVTSFEETYGYRLKRSRQNSIAAFNLSRRYTRDRVLGAIKAAYVARDDTYCPQIASLEDLWSKWEKLEMYYARRVQQDTNKRSKVAILTEE